MSIPFENKLAEKLQALREMRALTQSELGKRAGMAAASISHFETGQRAPSLESLIKLADALDVSVDTLLGRAPVVSSAGMDAIFLRASKADSQTLETVRRVMEALLKDVKVE
jgi:transcriptional regulator with XRE-family HTH domain